MEENGAAKGQELASKKVKHISEPVLILFSVGETVFAESENFLVGHELWLGFDSL